MEHLRSKNVVFAIVMALLVVQSSTQTQEDENVAEIRRTLYNICSTKYPITEELKNNVKKSIISEDQNFKCFLKCSLDEMSLIDEDGIIDGDSLQEMVPVSMKPIFEKLILNCVKPIKQDPCEAAFNFVSCGVKLNPLAVSLLPL